MVSARFLLRQFKYAVLIAFIVAAVVTPSEDPGNQTILAATMIGLYAICIAIAAVFGRKREARDVAMLLIGASAPLWGPKVVPFRRRA